MGSVPSRRIRSSGRRGRHPPVTSGEGGEEGQSGGGGGGLPDVLERLTDAELLRVTTFYRGRLEEVVNPSAHDLAAALSEFPAFREELKGAKDQLLTAPETDRVGGFFTAVMDAGGSGVRELWRALGQVSGRNPALRDVLQEVQGRGADLLLYVTWNSLSEELPDYMEVIRQASLRHRQDILRQLRLLWEAEAEAEDPWHSALPEDYPELLAVSHAPEPGSGSGPGPGTEGSAVESQTVRPLDPRLHLFPPSSSSSGAGGPAALTVMTGPPGVGKTTCLRRLVSEWAAGPSVYPELHFLFYRELWGSDPEQSLSALLLGLYPGLAPVLPALWSRPQALAFVFDGLERLDSSQLPPRVPGPSPRSRPTTPSPPATSSSPWPAVAYYPAAGCCYPAGRTPPRTLLSCRPQLWAEVRGLSPGSWRAHLLRCFPGDPDAGRRLLSRLLASPLLAGLCSNPSYCWLACRCLAPGAGAETETETGGDKGPVTGTEFLARYLRWALIQDVRPPLPRRDLRSLLLRLGAVALRDVGDGGRPFGPSEWGLRVSELPRCLVRPGPVPGSYSFRQPPVTEFLAALSQLLGPRPRQALRDTQEAEGEDGRYAGVLRCAAGLSRRPASGPLRPLLGPLSRRSVCGALRWLNGLSLQGAARAKEGGRRELLEPALCLHEARHRRLALRLAAGLSGRRLVVSGAEPGVRLDARDCAALAYLLGPPGGPDTCDLGGCWVGDEGLRSLMPGLMHCKKLSLANNGLGDEGVRILAVLLRDPECQITDLDLTQNELTPSCIPDLASGALSLLGLSLNENRLGDDGVRQLCEGLAVPACRMEVLQLSRNGLTGDCVPGLSKLLTVWNRLHWLILDGNGLGDDGVRGLAASLSTARLRALGLASNRLTDACVPELVGALGVQRTVRRLKLSNNLFTDASLPHFSNLVSTCHRLQKLGLANNLFSTSGQRSLGFIDQAQKSLHLIVK